MAQAPAKLWIAHATKNEHQQIWLAQRDDSRSATRVAKYAMDAYATGLANSVVKLDAGADNICGHEQIQSKRIKK